jgi:hypothetical protein
LKSFQDGAMEPPQSCIAGDRLENSIGQLIVPSDCRLTIFSGKSEFLGLRPDVIMPEGTIRILSSLSG